MSKLLDWEPRRDPTPQDSVDAEAALRMELLAQTDAKLDRVSARLDRFAEELIRWKQTGEEAGNCRRKL